jgi:hypothetical protein
MALVQLLIDYVRDAGLPGKLRVMTVSCNVGVRQESWFRITLQPVNRNHKLPAL